MAVVGGTLRLLNSRRVPKPKDALPRSRPPSVISRPSTAWGRNYFRSHRAGVMPPKPPKPKPPCWRVILQELIP